VTLLLEIILRPALWNMDVCCHVRKNSILSHMNPLHNLKPFIFNILFNIIFASVSVKRGFFSSGFPTKPTYGCVGSGMHATCTAHLSPLIS
jgi:hypothetical protein